MVHTVGIRTNTITRAVCIGYAYFNSFPFTNVAHPTTPGTPTVTLSGPVSEITICEDILIYVY